MGMRDSEEKLPLRDEASIITGSLRDELALLHSGHTAIAADSPARALEMARCYASRYPTGYFRPEADALRIHALVMRGRSGEARELARQFAANHGASPLATRLRHLADSMGSA